MFVFDQGMLFVKCDKELVVRLRNLATLELGTENPSVRNVEVTNATGTHLGVGFQCENHPTILYFEEKVAKEVPAEPVAVVEEEKTDEQKNN